MIKRRFLSPELCAQARDYVWQRAPDLETSVGLSGGPMRREDPDTWVGPFTAAPSEPSTGGTSPDGYLNGNRWIFQCPFGSSELFCDLLPRRCMPIAEQLLGRPLVQPVPDAPFNKARWTWERGAGLHGCGMYATVPTREGEGPGRELRRPRTQENIHIDAMACNLGCVGLIDDVPPDGGGFCVYPRSHRRLHHAVDHAYATSFNEHYYAVTQDIVQNEPPLVFEGSAGDVIIYHVK